MWFYNFFSKLDAKQGYWNVKHDAASSLMITFYTLFGEVQTAKNAFWIQDESGHLPEED